MRHFACCALSLIAATGSVATAATAVATYSFHDNFNADQAGVPAVMPEDPTNTSGFVSANVGGITRDVWAFNGNANPTNQQSGFTMSTAGLITNPGKYSVDLVCGFSTGANAWRRILDVQNRQSDNGFYVDPTNNLDIYPVAGSTAAWSNNVFHHIVLTVDNTTSPATVNAYLDNVSQFTAMTDELNLNYDPTNNPTRLIGFFLDNTAGSGLYEWSPGQIALARLWDGALTPAEAEALLPEPAALSLLAAGVLLLRRR